ncbi:hypothetical protein BJ986_002831 [Phycicoccus badiiscoriae]|uniref:Uncharacterized protein n=1 Tax=Pedococcus badiiscoriae TaxID=642776 RepID=A0A852WNB7_9MICO|nr:hypothetical protein [Pedococcus badiiscoriae]NYG08344.1 hypothetical protein [Pedococcus badiiscoriae]
MLSTGLAGVALVTGQPILASPLGESYQGITVGLLALLCSCVGFALSLRSRAARALSVRAGARYRLLWFVVQLLVVVAVAESVAGLDLAPRRLVFAVGWGAGVAGLLALVSEGASILYGFLLFASAVLTPRGEPARWWAPLAHAPVRDGGVVVAAIVLLACGAVYVANPRRGRGF